MWFRSKMALFHSIFIIQGQLALTVFPRNVGAYSLCFLQVSNKFVHRMSPWQRPHLGTIAVRNGIAAVSVAPATRFFLKLAGK
jgi:hypothetical protein